MTTPVDEREVASHLAGCADALHVSAPRWDDVRRGMRRVRRRRRVRRAGATVAALASVAVLAVGVQAGMLPYPTWAPAVVLPASGGPSALAGQPTKGSLADDEAWLAAFREHVAGLREDESGGETWQVGDPADVTVIFAGDVAGHRIAAVEAPYRWGMVEAPQQVWFMGPKGAEPSDMTKHLNQEPRDVMAVQFGPGTGYPKAVERTGWLVLTPDERTVTLVGPPEYAADGSVRRPETVLEPAQPGIYIWSAPGDVGAVSVTVAGEQEMLQYSGGVAEVPVPAPLRGEAPDDGAVSSALGGLYAQAGLPPSGAEPVVLWAGGPDGAPAAVLGLRTPSGALVIGAFHEDADDPAFDGWLAQDLAAVLPADDMDRLALAWQQQSTTWTTAPEGDGLSGASRAATSVGVLGPVGAVTAQLLDGGNGSVVATTALDEGGAVVDAPGARLVRFLDDSGAVVAEVKVRPWSETVGAPLWEP